MSCVGDAVKQYEFKERGIAVTALVLAFFVFGGVALSAVGIEAVIFAVLCGAFVLGVTVYTCFQTRIISEAGITVKTILKTTFVPWADVERMGVAHLPAGPGWRWNLSVTCRTASGKRRDFLFPCTEAVRSAVTEFYGELDFDQSLPSSMAPGGDPLPAEIVNPWGEERRVFGVVGAFVGVCGAIVGLVTGDWLVAAFSILIALVFVAGFFTDYPYVSMNDAGVTFRFLLRRQFLPWPEFRQAGVCLFQTRKPGGIVHNSYKLGLLLPNGVPKMPGQRISYHRNLGCILYLPDTRQIRDYIIAHYGLLDFDESVDPRGYSVVMD